MKILASANDRQPRAQRRGIDSNSIQGKRASGRTYLAGRSASTLTNRHLVTDAIG